MFTCTIIGGYVSADMMCGIREHFEQWGVRDNFLGNTFEQARCLGAFGSRRSPRSLTIFFRSKGVVGRRATGLSIEAPVYHGTGSRGI